MQPLSAIRLGFLLVSMSIVLSACGGGGGSGTNDSVADQDLPILALSSPSNGVILTNQSSFPVFGATLPRASLTINGIVVTTDPNGLFSTTVPLLTGDNNIAVIASLDGLETRVNFTVTLQQTPPLLNVSEPPAQLVTNASNTNVTGDTASSGVKIWINDVEQTLNNGEFDATLALQDGLNLIRIIAEDEAGNRSLVDRQVTRDTNAPILAVTSPADGSTIYREPLVITGFSEPGATVTINGVAADLLPSPGEFEATLSSWEAVTNATVIATDSAGNSTQLLLTVNRFANPATTVYVTPATAGGADGASCGAVTSPCGSINFALSRASALFAKRVLVGNGIYTEAPVLVNGIDLLSGFDVDFEQRDLATLKAEIWGDGTSRSVVAAGISMPTLLEGFTIRGPLMAGASSNSTGIYIVDSSNALVVRENNIYSGRAASGTNGAAGSDGQDGNNGVDGVDGIITPALCQTQDLNTGGSGGQLIASATDISGGAGGSNIACPVAGLSEFSGEDGDIGLNSGGSGGDAGNDFELSTVCTLPGQPTDGAAGTIGAMGSHGGAGAGGLASNSSLIANNWVTASGSVGLSGSHGGGGGGGGAGGSAFCVSSCTSERLGGTGAGGGSGGAAGSGGIAGSGGGASFGIFLSYQSLPLTLPEISNNIIFNGVAGNGGIGGQGGVAGIHGLGGSGGVGGFCYGQGGSGGEGGQGGHGGGGGGGAGGISVGLFVNLNGYAGTPTYAATNTIDTTTGIAGGGGAGGLSFGNSGANGEAGSVSEVLYLP